MRILGVSGSLRAASHNTAVLRTLAGRMPEGVELVLFDELKAVPPYDADDDVDPAPAGATAFRQAIASADAVLFCTPEYNASIPGVLKNAVDWASRPFPDNTFKGKPVAVIGATTGSFGAVWAQAELRKALGTTGARVVKDGVPIAQVGTLLDDHGRLTGDDLLSKLDAVVAALVEEAEISASLKTRA